LWSVDLLVLLAEVERISDEKGGGRRVSLQYMDTWNLSWFHAKCTNLATTFSCIRFLLNTDVAVYTIRVEFLCQMHFA
jgi:hypothetical protein